MAKASAGRVWTCKLAALLTLAGCVKNYELDAVSQSRRPTPAKGDHPRVSLDRNDLSVKGSFLVLLNSQCKVEQLKDAEAVSAHRLSMTTGKSQLAPGTPPPIAVPASGGAGGDAKDKPTWASLNPRSNVCQQRITAYAIDQCKFIVQHQNQTSVTAGLITSLFSAGSALAVDAAYLAHPHAAKDSSAALIASAVLANSDKIKVLSPTTVLIKDMLPVGAQYAELLGINDDRDLAESYGPKDDSSLRFARTHDAIMSTCTGVAVGV